MNPRLILLAALLAAPALHAALPDAVPYQGRIAANGTAYTGTGYFKFAVYQQTPGAPASAALLWTSATGTATGAPAEPATAVALPVTNGLFALGLGDTAVAGMATLPTSLAPADNQHAFVRVWFSTTGAAGSFQALAPDTELRSVPFAREAGSVAGFATANLPQLNAANTFTNVSGLTVQGAAPADNSPAAGVTVPVSGPGARLEFLPGLAAFRAGYVDGSQWDSANIGLYSTALGFNTSAAALRSTALGNGASANGIGSLSIGTGTTANGWNATALGYSSIADGYAATALGRGTFSASEAEIALGSYNTFYSPSSWYGWSPTDRLLTIGNGSSNSARSDALVMLKNGATTLNGSLRLNDINGLLVQGTGPSDTTPAPGTSVPASGPGTRMFFIPGLSAFRAGTAGGTEWDASNIGSYSVAMGAGTYAKGTASVAMGYGSAATGAYATALGYACQAQGEAATAHGYYCDATGQFATALGNNTVANGKSSTAMGESTRATGACSSATGYYSTASGAYCTAMGHYTNASGLSATALGSGTTASNDYSTAMGNSTTASGLYSTAMGDSTLSQGQASTTMGTHTTASGYNSTAMGSESEATGPMSTAIGRGVQAYGAYETAVGMYNTPSPQNVQSRCFVAGNGGSNTARSNAFIVYYSGNAWLQGTLTQGSDRNRKTDIVPADTAAVLTKVAALPVSTWKYKEETVTHLGPMAQDFFAAFQLGGTDTGIASVDADGVALAAIQELKKQLDAKEARIAQLEREQAATNARLAALEAKLH